MEIRELNQSEKRLTRSLYEEIFPDDSKAFVDYYYEWKNSDNIILVVKEAGVMAAMFHLNPYVLMVEGEEKMTHYIVAVATLKEHRRKGYMSKLMRHALTELYEAGEIFTFLMPAAQQIYLPHGFRVICMQDKRYYTDEDRDNPDSGLVPATAADAQEIAACAENWLSGHYQVYAKRDGAYYRRMINELASDGGRLMVKRQEGKIIDIKLDTEIPKEEMPIMARIVDARRLLMSLHLKGLIRVTFTIKDPIIEENNRCLFMTGTEHSGIMVMDAEGEDSEGTLTIEALTEFVFGRKKASQLDGEPGVRVSGHMAEELTKIITLDKVFLNEVV